MEELARVYSEALFDAAKEQGKVDLIRDQLGAFADALEQHHELNTFFFSPSFSTREKQDGDRACARGGGRVLRQLLKVLIDNHRMPVIFRIERQYEVLWQEENRLLPVEITERGRARRVGREADSESASSSRRGAASSLRAASTRASSAGWSSV